MSDTICAISTPNGIGGIAVIRLSGDNAFAIAAALLSFKKKNHRIERQESYTIAMADLMDSDSLIDQVLISTFKAPHTYTGENIVEISCHGSSFVQKRILELLIEQGARFAKAGEFTERAFLNGKLDLAQAEAVADLIHSESESAHKLAINQLRGGYSKKIQELRSQLLDFAALIELELDFSEEDVEFANRSQLKLLLEKIKNELRELTHSFKLGQVMKNGIPVAIVGQPNVGKSTLLNALLNEERALVSDIPGTTRDTVEDTLNINGTLFRFIDTAGIRESKDLVENMGIKRTFKAIEQAQVLICMADSADFGEFEKLIQSVDISDKLVFFVANKTENWDKNRLAEYKGFDMFYISAKFNAGVDLIVNKLSEYSQKTNQLTDRTLVSNLRHYEALSKALKHISAVEDGFKADVPSDLIAIDIRSALHELGSITGEISNEDVLGAIFGRFCIGK